jgi:hypothetical protein
LVEESILADLARAHSRRTLKDGTEFDLSAYDEWGVLIAFRRQVDGRVEFIDFVFFD